VDKIKTTLIIYDCDGVLIDSREANRAFYNDILAHFGLPLLTEEQLDYVQVSTSGQAVDLLFTDTPWKDAAQAYQLTLDNEPYIARLRLMPHVRGVLAALRPHCRTAVATNRGRSLSPILEHFHLNGLLDYTVSSYDVAIPKPHPECLFKVLDYFQAPPQAALYIGDAEVDRLVAGRAGVPFCAYQNPGLEACFHLMDHLDLLRFLGIKTEKSVFFSPKTEN